MNSLAADEEESSPSFDPKAFDSLFALERKHYWFRARNEVIDTAMRRHNVAPGEDARVLEVGCGNSNVLSYLARTMGRKTWIGGDLFLEGLQHSRERMDLPLVQLDVHSLPFEGSLDAVCTFDVLEHLRDDTQVLAEIYRALRPGGQIVLTVPAYQRLWSYFDELSCHKRRYSKTELSRKLTTAGFEVQMMSHYMAVLLPLVFLQRKILFRLNSHSERSISTDIRVLPVVNQLLYWVCRAEKRLVSLTGLPFGTSIIAVGRRP
jgi:SAM-dependent methyltransferase